MPKLPKRVQKWEGDRLATHPVADAVKLVKANAAPVNVALNAGCSAEEHEKLAAKPVRFF